MQIESRRSEAVRAAVAGAPVLYTAGGPGAGEYHCASCGYGISVRSVLPDCPMCRGSAWKASGERALAPL